MLKYLMLIGLGFVLGYWTARRRGPSVRIEPLEEARLSPEALAQIDAAIDRGDKIEAIRIARLDAGSGLAEAKKFIDQRHRSRRPGDPIER